MFAKKLCSSPLISVCVPVFETERFLARCFRSVFMQDFDSFEIVVVSDASDGKDKNGRSAKKIVHELEKEGNKNRKAQGLSAVKVIFEEHHENRGVLEVRRTMAYEASGEYIFSLDSDDELVPETLSLLWKNVKAADGAERDIVHGTFVSGWYDTEGKFNPLEHSKCGAIFYGEVLGHEVFSKWIEGKISGNVCGKLIRRELFIQAFENIPYTECNMADDYLIFFFIAQLAKSYIGLPEKIYRYRITSGMSSARKIDTLRKWQLVCSASSVFAVISTWIDEKKQTGDLQISEEEILKIREMAGHYLLNNLVQMKETVIPELKDEAYKMLCEYWGKDAVERIKSQMSD